MSLEYSTIKTERIATISVQYLFSQDLCLDKRIKCLELVAKGGFRSYVPLLVINTNHLKYLEDELLKINGIHEDVVFYIVDLHPIRSVL